MHALPSGPRLVTWTKTYVYDRIYRIVWSCQRAKCVYILVLRLLTFCRDSPVVARVVVLGLSEDISQVHFRRLPKEKLPMHAPRISYHSF
jgi:hypothetical protein